MRFGKKMRLGDDEDRKFSMDKIVLITGATSGIGWETAKRFARAKYRVIAIGRNFEKLRQLEVELGIGRHVFWQCDLTSETERAQTIAKVLADFPAIDVLVNNAGIGYFASFAASQESVWRRVFEINMFVPMILTHALLPALIARRGVVVNVASVAGKRTFKHLTAYCASKFALMGFSNSLRRELRFDGVPVHVAVVCPPATDTAFFNHAGYDTFDQDHPLVNLLAPTVVAEKIFVAAQKRKREIIVTTRAKILDFFSALFPSWIEQVEDSVAKKL